MSYVSIYGDWARGGMRSLPAAEALAFIEAQGEDRLVLILGGMREGYLGREVLSLDGLRAIA